MAEATLADLSLGIKKTNDTLAENLSAQKKLNALIIKQQKERFGGDDLEAEREKNKSQAEAETIRESKSGGGVSDGGGFLSGLGIGGALAKAGGAMGLASMIGKKGIRTALLVALADEAGNAVEAYTNSAEAGDAVERGMVAGGIASIFGLKFGLIGGAIAAAMTKENQEKLGELKETIDTQLGPAKDRLNKALEQFGMRIPSVETVLSSITTTFGGAIDGLNNLAKGDYSELKTDLTNIGLTAAGIFAIMKPGKSLGLLFKTLKLPFTVLKTALAGLVGLSTTAAVTTATGTTAAAAAAATTFKGGTKGVTTSGEKVTFNEKTQRFHSDKTNKMVKAADVKGAKLPKPQAGAATTTPKPTGGGKAIAGRLGTFLRFPGIAALLGAYGLYDVLNSDAPDDVKKKELTKFMGGMIGSVAGVKFGALLGGALGTIGFPGLGSLAGGLGGATLFGTAGYFGGEALAGSLANFIMGGKPKASTGETSSAPVALPSTNTAVDGGLSAAASNQATMTRPDRSTPIQSGGAMGEFGGGSTVIAPTITNNTGQSTTVITPTSPNANNSEDPVREMTGIRGAFVL